MPEQFDTFDRQHRNFYMNIESIVGGAVVDKYKGFSFRPAGEILEEIKSTLEYLARIDKKLVAVSNSHPYYFIMGERLAQCVQVGYKQRLETIKKEFDAGNSGRSMEATALIVAILKICQTINHMIDN